MKHIHTCLPLRGPPHRKAVHVGDLRGDAPALLCLIVRESIVVAPKLTWRKMLPNPRKKCVMRAQP